MLSILQRKGRIAIAELAELINLSDTPCLRRMKKLEQAGVITGYGAQLDPRALGYTVTVLASVRLVRNSASAASEFEQAVAELPPVMECSVVTGAHDYVLKIIARDLEDYEAFVKASLGHLDCVAAIESTVVLKQTFSRTTLPLGEGG